LDDTALHPRPGQDNDLNAVGRITQQIVVALKYLRDRRGMKASCLLLSLQIFTLLQLGNMDTIEELREAPVLFRAFPAVDIIDRADIHRLYLMSDILEPQTGTYADQGTEDLVRAIRTRQAVVPVSLQVVPLLLVKFLLFSFCIFFFLMVLIM
jgi:hypothetical protein